MKTIHITSQDELPDVAEAVIEALGRRTAEWVWDLRELSKTFWDLTISSAPPHFRETATGSVRKPYIKKSAAA